MPKFVELMNTDNKRELYRLVIFINLTVNFIFDTFLDNCD